MLCPSRALLAAAIGSVLLIALAVAGCSPSGPTWTDSGASYTTQSVSAVLDKADISDFKDTPTADARELRHEALVHLRERGGHASAAADLITKTLPAETQGVPIYVERASMGGQPAYLLVEAIGPDKGNLTTKRLWVLSDTGAVLFVGTR